MSSGSAPIATGSPARSSTSVSTQGTGETSSRPNRSRACSARFAPMFVSLPGIARHKVGNLAQSIKCQIGQAGDVSTFELQFPPEELAALARRFPPMEDARYLAAGAAARARGHYTCAEFLEVCAWKTVRSRPKVAINSSRSVAAATGLAFATTDEAARMGALLELDGVGVPTASTLLYFAFPEDYPVLDVRALESLGVRPRSQYPVAFWLGYLAACRDLAQRHGVDLRTLDKALWQHSKES